MPGFGPLFSKAKHFVYRILRRREVEHDLDEEVRAYFEILVQRGIRRGLSREAAARAARVEFEGPEQVKEKVREVRVGATIETFFQDLRYAARGLRRDSGFTFFAVVTIALALGANAAIFSLIDGVLLKSVEYPEPERIVRLAENRIGRGRNAIAAANYVDWTKLSHSFESMAARTSGGKTYLPDTPGSVPVNLLIGVVSAPFFDVFGVKPALGRTFATDEDQPGKEKVIVLTHRFWSNRMGSDPGAVGRSILLDNEPYTVIGVLPGASAFDRRGEDVWIPLAFPPNPARAYHTLQAFARLKRGVTLEQADAELKSIAAGIAERYPAEKKGWTATVDGFVDNIVGSQLRLSLSILMWAVVAVLLIGCANLANLLMARATLRSREIALRRAIGAGRGRVVRMLLTESLLLSACGALVGVPLGYALLEGMQGLMPGGFLPADASVAMDGRALLFLTAATLFTCVAAGLAPALQASGRGPAASLKEGGRSYTSGRGKLVARNLFIGAQVAVAFVLLVGSGLLVRSLQRVMNVDPGFDSEGLIVARVPFSGDDLDIAAMRRHFDRILEEVRAVPGIREVAVTNGPPLGGWPDGMPYWLDGKPDENVGLGFKVVSPEYLRVLRLPLKAGRFLDQRDTEGAPLVVVVNESFVRRHYPNENPVGKSIVVRKILPARSGLGPQASWEIVGVVGDEKARGLENETGAGVYASFAQSPAVGLAIVVRSSGDPRAMIQSMAQAVTKVQRTQVLVEASTLEEVKSGSLRSRRWTLSLLGGFALLAMLLACAGIYAVLSFVTARRTHEMGIRAALGASRTTIIRLVVVGGALPVFAGILVGLGGAMELTRFIESMLFATDPLDAWTLVGVSLLFATVALAACMLPAWRAARVDPMAALRQE